MTFPINKEEFVDKWLKTIGEHDDTDREMAEAIVSLTNRAYYAGLAISIHSTARVETPSLP